MVTNCRTFIKQSDDLKGSVEEALEFIKWKNIVKSDSKVFIKPNFTFPYYKEGITTSPPFISCFLEFMKDRVDEVILGESNGGNYSFTADEAFDGHGMHQICKDNGVELKNLSKLPSKFVEEEIQGKKVKVKLPELLINDIDCFISLPVLKVHVMTNVTLSIKNLWGCYPDTMRCLHHQDLSRKLTLITKTLNPKMVLMDGIYALNGHGPMYGEAKKTNLILSSNNSVAIDTVGTKIMGIPIQKVEHVLMAEKEGLGTTNIKKIHMNEDWKKFQMHFSVNKTAIDTLSTLLFKSETIAKLVMDSPLTPIIYKTAGLLRNSDEKEVVSELNRYCK